MASNRRYLHISLVVLLVGPIGCSSDPETAPKSEDAGSAADAGAPLGLPLDRCDGNHVPDQLFAGEVALTFDDGPNPSTTLQVMEVLRRHGAPATFFIQGSRVSGPEAHHILDEMVADPDFIIANHTVTHASLDELSADLVAREIDGVEAILRAHHETHRYFRFPFSRASCEAMQLVRERGLTPVGVQVDSADWCFSAGTPGECDWTLVPVEYQDGGMIDYVLEQLAVLDGGVLLMHDVHPYTAEQLEPMLSAIEDAGYHFVALDDARVFPRLNEQRFVGDACRTDADCTFAPDAYCHRAGFCTVPCAGTCPDRRGWAPTFCVAEAQAGVCLSVQSPLDRDCADVPGTEPRPMPRYGASTEYEVVCAPTP